MNIYNGHFDLKAGASDLQFVENLERFLNHLKAKGHVATWRLMRRKLGLGPKEFGEFHLMIETETMDDLDRAFGLAARRSGDVEAMHFGVNSMIDRVTFSLYRDFPDPVRESGEELF